MSSPSIKYSIDSKFEKCPARCGCESLLDFIRHYAEIREYGEAE